MPAAFQKRVLMIGILGALLLRALMIFGGAWLVERFHWAMYLFGAFLVFTGVRMWRAAGQEPDLADNPLLRWLNRHIKVAPDYAGQRLFTRVVGTLLLSLRVPRMGAARGAYPFPPKRQPPRPAYGSPSQ